MDRSVTIFHTNCRLKWNCYQCPVCFHIKNPHLLKNSVCMKCEAKDSLWYCIICGHVGCGWGVQSHALEHFQETSHEYVMGLSKFEVFNYKSQQYSMHEINGYMIKPDSRLSFHQTNIQNNCPCIVCQHNLSPKLLKQAVCMICEICDAKNLWICLNCRHIGCGRNENHHALQHFKKAKHPHVMQLENFSIWDYKEAKYRHNHLNGLSELNESGSQLIKDKFAVTKINDSLKVGHSETTTVSKGSFSPQKEPSKVAKLLKLQPEYIIKRIDLLERQWQEFGNLAEANKKIIVIEQRLVQLTGEKKKLEQKLHEHDTKLSELITQFAGDYKNYSRKKYVNRVEIVTMEQPSNSSRSPAVKPRSSPQINIISLFILGLFVYYFLKLSLQKIFEIFINLF